MRFLISSISTYSIILHTGGCHQNTLDESRFCPSAALTGRGEAGNCNTVACFAQPGEQHSLPVGDRHNAHAFVYVLEGSVVMQLKGPAQLGVALLFRKTH
jgi:hypothetical protein